MLLGPVVSLPPTRSLTSSTGLLLHPAGSCGRRVTPISLGELGLVADQLSRSAADWAALGAGGAERRWELVVQTAGLQAWVIAWPPGGGIELHDHGASAGAVAVVAGSLRETSVHREHGQLAVRTRTLRPTGPTLSIGAGQVHDVVNMGPDRAVSVHVYSPRLTAMTYFEIVGDELHQRRTERLDLGRPDEVVARDRAS